MGDLVVDSSVVAKWVLPEPDLRRAPVRIEPAGRLLQSAFEIALRYDRAVYDALFVALAVDLDLRGVTADEPLYNAVHADFPNVILLRDV